MSWVERVDQFVDRLSDRLNPLLVKEVRQMLKGKLFLTTFSLLLWGLWISSVVGVYLAGASIDDHGFPGLLGAYLVGLQITLLVFVPFIAFRSMQAETEENTWELIAITTLSARRIISGKISSALVLSFLLMTVITPFVAFCSLLPGFEWPVIAIVLTLTMIFSLLNTTISVMLSSLTTNRVWQVVSMLALLAALSFEAWAVCSSTFELANGASVESLIELIANAMLGDRNRYSSTASLGLGFEAWASVAIFVAFILAYAYLFFEIAVSRVTFEADSRSARIRVICSVLYALQWCLLVGSNASNYDAFTTALNLFVLHWAIFGISACLEPETISTRIRRRLTGWSRLRSPFLPGGSRALVFMLLHLGAVPLIASTSLESQWWVASGPVVTTWSMYLLIYTTLAVASCRALLAVRPGISRTYLRVGVVVCVVVSMLPSAILNEIAPLGSGSFFLLLILNPFSYSVLGGDWAIPAPLMIIALIGVHLNWEIIKRSVLDVAPVALEAEPDTNVATRSESLSAVARTE